MPQSLARKLLLKPGARAALIGAPAGSRAKLDPLPEGVVLGERVQRGLDWALLFAEQAADLERRLPAVAAAMNPDGLLWVCYRKGASKAGTDLNRDILWALAGGYGLTGVTLVAFDDAWSAMRFRPTS